MAKEQNPIRQIELKIAFDVLADYFLALPAALDAKKVPVVSPPPGG